MAKYMLQYGDGRTWEIESDDEAALNPATANTRIKFTDSDGDDWNIDSNNLKIKKLNP